MELGADELVVDAAALDCELLVEEVLLGALDEDDAELDVLVVEAAALDELLLEEVLLIPVGVEELDEVVIEMDVTLLDWELPDDEVLD